MPTAPRKQLLDNQTQEEVLRNFETHWDEDKLVEQTSQIPQSVPWRVALLRELVKIDLRLQWQKGNRRTLESYLLKYPELGTPETVEFDLIQAETQARRRTGDSVTFADLRKRFPGQMEQRLRELEQFSPAPAAPASTDTLIQPSVPPSPPDPSLPATPSGTAQQLPTELSVQGPGADGADAPNPVESASEISATLRPIESASEISVSADSSQGAVPRDRYTVLRELGRGAMGTVYLVQDTLLSRQVAMKVPHFQPGDGPEMRKRFMREARAAAVLNHPNICPIYDVGERSGSLYLTMAHIAGKTLDRVLDETRPMAQRRAVEIVYKLACALDEAHRHGVVHRDLKPGNVMVNHRGDPIIMDFGLARQMADSRMTHQGSVLGTPAYMSPEQVRGDLAATGPATDQYSLGVVLYELLTGQVPFKGSIGMVMSKILTEAPRRPRELRPDLDPALEQICLKAMAMRIADRFASLGDFAAALEPFLRAPATIPGVSPQTPATVPRVALPSHNRGIEPDAEYLAEDFLATIAPSLPASAELPRPASTAERTGVTETLSEWNRPATAPMHQARRETISRKAPPKFFPVLLVVLLGLIGGTLGYFSFIGEQQEDPTTSAPSVLADNSSWGLWAGFGMVVVVATVAGIWYTAAALHAWRWRRANLALSQVSGTLPSALAESPTAVSHTSIAPKPQTIWPGPPVESAAPALPTAPVDRPAPAINPPTQSTRPIQRLGKYELLHKLGDGPTGNVFLARHIELGSQAVVKFLKGARFFYPDHRKRLLREADVGLKLNHPAICRIRDAGTTETEDFYLVLEYIEGKTLQTCIRESPNGLALAAVYKYAYQFFMALDYLALQGVVHRDIKPAHLMVCAGEQIKLIGLGLAKIPDAEEQQLTMAGHILGTPAYMAPEQIQNASAVTIRSDWYAAGVTLYEMVTATTPFPSESPAKRLRMVRENAPPDPTLRRPDLPEPLANLIRRLLDNDPKQRPEPKEVLDVLRSLAQNEAALSQSILAPSPILSSLGGQTSLVRHEVQRAEKVSEAPGTDALWQLFRREDGLASVGKYILGERLGTRPGVATYRAYHQEEHQEEQLPYIIRLLPPDELITHHKLSDLHQRREQLSKVSARSRYLACLLEVGKAPVVRGTLDALYYLVEECLPGKTLATIRDNPCHRRLRLMERCLSQALHGLDALHHNGFLHGNLHPGKFYYDSESRRLRLADLSRAGPVADAHSNLMLEQPSRHRKYLAPEILIDRMPLSPRAEQYALGVIFIEGLLGRSLRNLSNPYFLSKRVRENLKEFLAELKGPCPHLQRVLRRMVASSPDKRYPDVRAILADLQTARQPADPQDPGGDYDLFVSYRRKTGGEVAQAVVAGLKTHKVNAFMDVNSLDSGPFNTQLLTTIENTPNFVVILTEGSLRRCIHDGDWLRKEIAHAIQERKNIIPVVMPDFTWPQDPEELPADIRTLSTFEAVPYTHAFFDAFIDKLRRFMKPGDAPKSHRPSSSL